MKQCVFVCVAGHAPGQLYTYPARCWRKKRRLNILEDPRLVPIEFKIGKKKGADHLRSFESIDKLKSIYLLTFIFNPHQINAPAVALSFNLQHVACMKRKYQ